MLLEQFEHCLFVRRRAGIVDSAEMDGGNSVFPGPFERARHAVVGQNKSNARGYAA